MTNKWLLLPGSNHSCGSARLGFDPIVSSLRLGNQFYPRFWFGFFGSHKLRFLAIRNRSVARRIRNQRVRFWCFRVWFSAPSNKDDRTKLAAMCLAYPPVAIEEPRCAAPPTTPLTHYAHESYVLISKPARECYMSLPYVFTKFCNNLHSRF